eukprot:UN26058
MVDSAILQYTKDKYFQTELGSYVLKAKMDKFGQAGKKKPKPKDVMFTMVRTEKDGALFYVSWTDDSSKDDKRVAIKMLSVEEKLIANFHSLPKEQKKRVFVVQTKEKRDPLVFLAEN